MPPKMRVTLGAPVTASRPPWHHPWPFLGSPMAVPFVASGVGFPWAQGNHMASGTCGTPQIHPMISVIWRGVPRFNDILVDPKWYVLSEKIGSTNGPLRKYQN